MLLYLYMIQEENPPIIKENLEDQESLEATDPLEQVEITVPVDPEEMRKLEDLNREIHFKSKETAEQIRNIQNENNKKIEPWDNTPTTTFNTPPQQNHKGRFRNTIMGLKIGLAGLLGLGATKEAKAGGGEDSLKLKNQVEKTAFADSSVSKGFTKGFEQTRDGETIGNINIEGHTYIPQKDTTKEFYSYHFSEESNSKNALGEILSIMKAKGFEPANGDMLEKIYQENKNNIEFMQKAKWLLAPTPEADGDDTRATEGFMVTKNGKTFFAIPEHSVFPTKNPNGLGRFEINQGFEASEYGILFYKKLEK